MDIDTQNNTKKSIKRNTFTNQDKRNTGRLSMQPIFQRSIFIFITKQTSIF